MSIDMRSSPEELHRRYGDDVAAVPHLVNEPRHLAATCDRAHRNGYATVEAAVARHRRKSFHTQRLTRKAAPQKQPRIAAGAPPHTPRRGAVS
jgi:hypothetical protein